MSAIHESQTHYKERQGKGIEFENTTPQKAPGKQTQKILNLDLSPLITPVNLFSRGLCSPHPCRSTSLELIQTPAPNRLPATFCASLLDTHEEKVPFTIGSKMSFEEAEEEQESYSNSDGVSDYFSEDHLQDSRIDEMSDSKDFQKEEQQEFEETPLTVKKRVLSKEQVEENTESNLKRAIPCNCKKTKCLKLYCDCFREGRMCGPLCNCSGCHNLEQFQEERKETQEALLKRNPLAFKQKIEENKHTKGCNCKKSGCQKKYCECFQAGLPCGEHCKCEECKNCAHDLQERELDLVKVESSRRNKRAKEVKG